MHHLSVSWHIIPLKFSSRNITLRVKRAHQSTNFQIFECFDESLPNSSCQFWNHKAKVYSNFASLFSVFSPLYFLSQNFILWTKTAHRNEIFRLLSGLVKLYQIPYVMFGTTSQFLFKLFINLQCHEKVFCTFLAETVHDLDKRSPSKCKISELSTAHVKFHQICTFIGSFCWKYIKF